MAKTKSRRRSSAAQSQEQRDAHEAQRHAPVALPSGGSFDREKLQEALEGVADRNSPDRDAEVRHALESSRTDAEHTSTAAPGAIPGHKLVDAEVQIAPGSTIGEGDDAQEIGKVVVTEQRQVLDPDQELDAQSAATGGQPVTGNRSEVLGIKDSAEASAGDDDNGTADDSDAAE